MKVLIVTPYIPDYRFEVFHALGELYDLTVLHSGSRVEKNEINYKQIILPLRKLGPITFFTLKSLKLYSQYELVVSDANIRHIDRNFLILNPFRKYKWIAWGIGVAASYEKKYDSDNSLDWLRHFIFRHADANVFYSDYPIPKYLKAGFPKETLFVANNTTHVSFNENAFFKKKHLLFVGKLYKQKRIYELLISYKNAASSAGYDLPLIIIGDGPEYNGIKQWIADYKLNDSISLKGPIFDHSILEKYFREAIACISPGQAGLSVLTSMGYGTPFITRKDAITGGEIFNIRNGVNGILYEKDEELELILTKINENPGIYIEMGKNARQFYLENRQIKDMVKGIKDAITFAMH